MERWEPKLIATSSRWRLHWAVAVVLCWLAATPVLAQPKSPPIDRDLRKLIFDGASFLVTARPPVVMKALRERPFRDSVTAVAEMGRQSGGAPSLATLDALTDERIALAIDVVGANDQAWVVYRITRYRDAKLAFEHLQSLDAAGALRREHRGEQVRVVRDAEGRQNLVWTFDARTLVEGNEVSISEAMSAAELDVPNDVPILEHLADAPPGSDFTLVFVAASYAELIQNYVKSLENAATADGTAAPLPPALKKAIAVLLETGAIVVGVQLDELRLGVSLAPLDEANLTAYHKHIAELLDEATPAWKNIRSRFSLDFVEFHQELAGTLAGGVDRALSKVSVQAKEGVVQIVVPGVGRKLSDLLPTLAPLVERWSAERELVAARQTLATLARGRSALVAARGSQPVFPRAIRDRSGKPLLSWRVALLQKTEYDSLYTRFKLDEPWDSEHNKPLIDLMPAVYRTPGVAAGRTVWATPMGPGTCYPNAATDLPFAEGRVGFVELSPDRAVVWTEPADWEVDPANPFAGLNASRSGVLAAFNNGLVDLVPLDVPRQHWLELLKPAEKRR